VANIGTAKKKTKGKPGTKNAENAHPRQVYTSESSDFTLLEKRWARVKRMVADAKWKWKTKEPSLKGL